jgi:tetratricopeptide (TPR) repeat protein
MSEDRESTLAAQLADAVARIHRLERRPESGAFEDLALAYYDRAGALSGLGRSREALEAYDVVVAKFADEPDPAVLETVCWALYGKVEELFAVGDREAARRTIDTFRQRCDEADDLRIQVWALEARGYWAWYLLGCGELLEGIELFDQVLREASAVAGEPAQVLIAQALRNKAWGLLQLGRLGDAWATYDEVLGRFGESAVPEIRQQIAWALLGKASVLLGQAEYESALNLISLLQEKFAGDADPAIRTAVEESLVNRAQILTYLRRDSEAAADLDRYKTNYLGDAGLNSRASALLTEGTIRLHQGDPAPAIRLYDQAIELARESEAGVGSTTRAIAGLHRANALAKLRRTDEARASLNSLIREFGADTRPALQDIARRAESALLALD